MIGRKFKAGLVLVALCSLLAAACSSSSNKSSPTTSSSGSGSGSSSTSQSAPTSGTMKAGPGVNTSTKTITLGVLTPLSGVVAVIGKPLTAGQQDYFNWLNANGGIDGWKVTLDVQDTQYSPQLQVQDYNQMVGNVAFIGQSLGSPTTQAIESLAQSQNVLLGTAAQDSLFTVHAINAVIGSPYAEDVANAMYYLTHILGKTDAKVGIVYQNDAYGQDGLRGYTAALNEYHFTDVGHATYNATDTVFTSQALAMKNAGAQYVMLTAIPNAAAGIIGAAAVIGYHPQWILQGPAWSEYLMTTDGAQNGKPTPIAPAMAGAWVMGDAAQWGDMSVPGMSQFLKVQEQFAPTQVPDYYYVYGYCLAQMEQQVLNKAITDNDLTRQGILNAKLNLGAVNFNGLYPSANYTPALGPASRMSAISEVTTSVSGFLKQIEPPFESPVASSLSAA
jgi:ABC-type branched-subunit amino acid transport system substrate-binding protein